LKRTIIYILSTNYAGSHYLSLLLGSHSHAIHLGEIKRLRDARMHQRRNVCYICEGKPSCVIFGGIGPDNIDDIYDIISDRVAPETTVYIDASKNTFWARRFLDNGRYVRKYIHLIRDPRAMVRRWMLTFKTPKQLMNQRLRIVKASPKRALPALLGSPERLYVDKWLLRNDEITRFIAGNHLDHIVVTYEDLAADTARELTRLCDWMGLKFEPEQMDYWNFQHHGSQKKDYAKSRERFFDLRWKEFLKPAAATKITKYKPVNDYLKNLGLRFTENGLTRQ
jgi:hypothetical protein